MIRLLRKNSKRKGKINTKLKMDLMAITTMIDKVKSTPEALPLREL